MAQSIGLVVLIAFVIPFALTPVADKLLKRWEVWDVPSDRSSHVALRTRGAGILVWVGTASGGLVIVARHGTDAGLALRYLIGGAAIALIGLLDDARHLGALPRLGVHLAAAVVFVTAISDADLSHIWAPIEVAPFVARASSALWITWLTNLWNFMDGSDGLAASQGVVAGMFGVAIAFTSEQTGLGVLSVGLAAACSGFLLHNWQPAKVFMGDAGSGAIGYTVGILTLYSGAMGGREGSVFLWFAPLGLFVADASITLVRRAVVAGRLGSPHRSHGYQLIIRLGWSHAKVALVEAGASSAFAAAALLLVRTARTNPLTIAIAAIGLVAGFSTVVTTLAVRREGVGILRE
jgi:Fuc2NAc and GlcNAc transferase